MDRQLKITLLGTGSSGGVPRVGGDWGACDPSEPKNRRLRCSALVETWDSETPDQKTIVLIDTSPDLREQLLDAEVQRLDAILFTHDHADQTHGIDDVRALAIRNRAQIKAYMDAPTHATLFPKFQYAFEGKGGYPPIIDVQPLIAPFEPVSVSGPGGALDCLPLDQEHGWIRSLGFRFRNIAYCNDLNALPDETMEHLAGLDLLIIDALRYTPHPSHAHLEQTLEWIETLKPRHSVITNLHVDFDYRTLKAELPAGVEPAFDGWSYTGTV
ncbi:MAG: MBL fold metallo-hydrolase [Hyphomonadaceae bacterium]|nr:MBL fold metallo-hydrolase [Hyphomonadaceae bacterium]